MKNSRNILFITRGDKSGANEVLIKLGEALTKNGHNVQVLVKEKTEENSLVVQLPARNEIIKPGFLLDENGSETFINRDPKYLFNSINEKFPLNDTNHILNHLRFNPQIIVVGITHDFLNTFDILNLQKATKAVVYNAAVDMSHFTGGCHFAWDCEGYKIGCDKVKCPAILDENFKNLAGENFLNKKKNIEEGNFKMIAGNEWSREQAKKSLFYHDQKNIYSLPGLVNTEIYTGKNRDSAKKVFNLDADKFYILAGSENNKDERKGYAYFVKALNEFWDKIKPSDRVKIEILTVSRTLDETSFSEIKFAKKHISFIKDVRLLSLLYQAADLYVNSSLEDSGPSMLQEAMACETPVVSFDMGAAKQFLTEENSGFLVENKNTAKMAEEILKVYRMSPKNRRKIGKTARNVVEKIGSLKGGVATFEEILKSHWEDFHQYIKLGISVAMCTYNGAEYLTEQLESILNQNLPPDEIVVCDDGSTDETLQILEDFNQKYPGIFRIFRNPEKLGVTKNFEKAINLCTQDLIFLSDQDDIWVPHKTEAVVRIFKKNPDIEAVAHNLNVYTAEMQDTGITLWQTLGFDHFLKNNNFGKDFLSYTMFFGNVVTGAALCIKKPETPVEFDDKSKFVLHDYQLGLRYIENNAIYFEAECLGYYRQHEKQQVGPVMDRIEAHNSAINTYYEGGNPRWNIQYMLHRMGGEEVFNFLNETRNSTSQKIISDNFRQNLKDYRRLNGNLKTAHFIMNWLRNSDNEKRKFIAKTLLKKG